MTGDDELNGNDGSDDLHGGGGSDVLNGGLGDDLLNGGLDADTMAGGWGHDAYVVDDLGDVVIEGKGEGRDIVYASVSYTLPANVETLVLRGGVHGIGNSLDNSIHGTPLDNTLAGLAGDDWLWGLEGDDTMNGGLGRRHGRG